MLPAWCVAAILGLWSSTEAAVYKGVVFEENIQWKFLHKFHFKATDAEDDTKTFLNVKMEELHYTHDNGTITTSNIQHQVLLYDDVNNTGFPTVWNSGRSCLYKEHQANKNGIVSVKSLKEDGITWSPKNRIPRAWYVAVSNCNPDTKKESQFIHVKYTLTFKNGDTKFRGHFSDDVTGIFEAVIVFFLLLLVLSGVYAYSFCLLCRDIGNMARFVVFAAGLAVWIHFFANLLELAHLDAYSKDGIGVPELHYFVMFLEQVPEIIIITLMLQVAKGLYISADNIQAQRGLAEIIVVYTLLVIGMVADAAASFNDVYDEYLYSTPFGLVIIVARFIVFFIFLSTLYHTRSREQLEIKRRFYVMFGMFGIYFFLTLPVSVVISTAVYDYHRKKAEYILFNIFDIIGYSFFWVFFGTGKGGWVKNEEVGTGGHAALGQVDEDDETRI